MRGFVSLQSKITLSFVAVVVVITLMLSIFLYAGFSAILTNQVVLGLNYLMDQSQLTLNGVLNEVNQGTVSLFTDNTISQDLCSCIQELVSA